MSQNSYTEVLTELHCSMCGGFLSCSPVRLLPRGTLICGQCSPPSDLSTYRAQVLETLLEKASFPCRFAERGCTKFSMFGQTVEHELKCEYRSFACPFIACSWIGSTSEMFNHFTEAHQEQVLENATLKLEVNQNAKGIAMVLKENIVFLVTYQYDAKGTDFTYVIRFCNSDSVLGASYRLQLVNNSDPEYTFNLKTVNCAVYDDSFRNSQIVQKLNLDKFLQCLDYPTSVLISIHFTTHSIDISCKSKVDYELPDYFKCHRCRNYLIPPLFELNKSIICCACAENFKRNSLIPHNDKELLQTLDKTLFPCRWRNCKLVTKNNNLNKHQLECRFRQYVCLVADCTASFSLTSTANHYEKKHGYQYTDKELSFKTSFAECHDDRGIFTIKKNTIIALQYSVESESVYHKVITLNLDTSDTGNFTSSLHFEHQHCKVKSKSFEINETEYLYISLSELPPCFNKDEALTGIFAI